MVTARTGRAYVIGTDVSGSTRISSRRGLELATGWRGLLSSDRCEGGNLHPRLAGHGGSWPVSDGQPVLEFSWLTAHGRAACVDTHGSHCSSRMPPEFRLPVV